MVRSVEGTESVSHNNIKFQVLHSVIVSKNYLTSFYFSCKLFKDAAPYTGLVLELG